MNIGSKLRAVFGAMAIVLLFTIGIAFWIGQESLDGTRRVIAHQTAIERLMETLSTLKDAETGQRGYLLTGEDQYLEPYHNAVQRVNGEVQTLHQLADSGDLSKPDVDALDVAITKKLAELEKTIAAREAGSAGAALQIVKTNQGKLLMDDIRDKTDAMLRTERGQLQSARQLVDIETELRTAVFAIAALGNIFFLGWSFLRLKNEMNQRDAATLELLRQKDLLGVTLKSIGDGVIVTDPQSRIKFINEIASQLTGWTQPEAFDQPCSTIFNIINEDSRRPVESPVDKVLKLGVIVGLANHTLLIRKDGTEIPIDDSGAPVRDPDGSIRGVVLIFRDFTAHKAAERDLRRAKTELEAANKAKDQFLAALSHELRTPLTPVLATLTTWENSPMLPADMLADVQMLRRNVELEARLIDDLLDLTRIVRGKLTLRLEAADVHDLIGSVTSMYQSEIQGRGLRLSMNLSATRHHVQADPARLQQVLWNVLKNATKFTDHGGDITLSTSNDNGEIRIRVTDSGIGMTAEILEKLFRPFEQGNHDIVRQYGGLGLGMAISKALVDAQGGVITAESKGPGHGSTFTITLPAINPPTPAANPETRTVKPPRQMLRIHLVEDHHDTARVLARLLKKQGHEVITSDSVATALQTAASQKFDLLLSDIGLPDGTGLELVQQLLHAGPIKAIALTGFGMDEDVAKCREAGFAAHLTKPVNFQTLEMVIHQLTDPAATSQ